MIIETESGPYEVVVGLEVHLQVASKSKLFSSSPTGFGEAPNENVSEIDIAMPGVLPRLNLQVAKLAARFGFAVGAEVQERSLFDRKHYFYPDLPQGYQITQFYEPIIRGGIIEVDLDDGSTKQIKIDRAHLEQDAGKLIHDIHPQFSCVDLNRAGVPLLEIVTDPDIRSPHEAMEYVKNLREIARTTGVSDGDMEKGSMRCDVNVSVRKVGSKEYGTRCEVKNVNSIKFVGKAIQHEARRHVEIIENGGKVGQQTLLFDGVTGTTSPMREKEDSLDYRYFPEPDLPPLILSQELLAELRACLPELPRQKRERYVRDYCLSAYDASVLSQDGEVAKFFDETVEACGNPKAVCNWITVEIFSRINQSGQEFCDALISPSNLAGLIKLIEGGVISGKIAKGVLDEMLSSGKDAESIVNEKGLKQIDDVDALRKVAAQVVEANPKQADAYRGGQHRLLGFFVGLVMKETQGKASPNTVNKLLKELLEE